MNQLLAMLVAAAAQKMGHDWRKAQGLPTLIRLRGGVAIDPATGQWHP